MNMQMNDACRKGLKKTNTCNNVYTAVTCK